MVKIQAGQYKSLITGLWKWTFRGLIAFLLYIAAVNYNVFWLFGDMPSLQELENPRSQLASVLISEDGAELGKYFRENRSPAEYEQLSPNIVNALLATEDARFSKHSGIDLRSTFRVITSFGTSGGGSTITQQLAKNLFDTRDADDPEEGNQYRGLLMRIKGLKTLIAKTKEWILAIRLESRYTKQEIMKMYLNEVSFGNNSYGIRVACKTYFGKDVSSVSVQEAALLVGLLQNPSLYDPKLRPDKARMRRNVVLGQMAKYNFITEEESLSLQEKSLDLNYRVENQNTGFAPYFREAIKKQLQGIIADLNSTRDEEDQLNLYTSGLRIYTTIDSRMQEYAQESLLQHMKQEQQKFYEHWKGRNPWVDEHMRELKGFLKTAMMRTQKYKALMEVYNGDEDKVWEDLKRPVRMTVFSWKGEIDTTMSPMDSLNYYKRILNCGFMAMDPNNGHVKAWVGGINYKFFKFDHVRQSKRQPGSTFKPFVYATAIENDIATPCDHFIDEPVTFGPEDGVLQSWTPQNADGKYSGESLSLRRAMGRSINSVSARLMKQIGPRKIADFAHKVGIQSPLAEVPSLCLGASEVSVFEQVAAYSTFVNGGDKVDPIMITRIEDKDGNILKEFFTISKPVITDQTAYLMTYMLRGAVLEPGGTAEGLKRYACAQGNEIGAKTGTTSNYSDGWFMGATQNLVTGVWVGGDDRSIHFRNINLGQGAKMAMPAFGLFMDKVYADRSLAEIGYKKEPFKKPDNFSFDFNCGTVAGQDSIQVISPTQKPKDEGLLQ
ncbi:penicillin-binding protein 1A [Pseudarcicella hirudinis]|uniref:Penicillin-binding protein 1A n=2 Tax=Pseudarcicella hirudinis TaxID=1079859 RepID=A0A1I5W122_9BACT|nr:transglycosylase domain-containing protein [Pseudarcicella hirudinis]SFQ13415.1 penicillin-binding protein 1A [Pseudarcicella hirudinis]